MKNIFSKITYRVTFGTLALFVMLGLGSVASAQWNSMSNDCPYTLAVTNFTQSQQPSVACWPSNSATLTDGDILNFNIYYHNTGTSTKNLTMRITPDPRIPSAQTTRTFTAELMENGVTVKTGTATVTLPANAKLKLQSTRIIDQGAWAPSPGITLGGSDDRVFSGGVVMNNLAPQDWKHQGAVRVVMSTSAGAVDPVGTKPTVNTDQPVVSGNTVVLNGNVGTQGLSTMAWFDYFTGSTCSSNGMSTVQNNRGVRDGSYSSNSITLTPGTYSYRAVASNSMGQTTATQCVSFTIYGGGGANIVTPSVTTKPVTSVNSTSGSAILNGYYNTGGDEDAIIAFEIYNNEGTYKETVGIDYPSAGTGNFSEEMYGLPNGTYNYRAIIANAVTLPKDVKGEWVTFTINRGGTSTSCTNGATNYPSCNNCSSGYTYQNGSCVWINTNTYVAPTAQVLNPVTINAYQATLGGYYTTGSCAGSTWFEYGPTTNLGSRTSAISRAANAAGNTSQTIYGLAPNTTYYYRVISQNCQNTVVSTETKSFTTTRPSIVDNITRIITPRETTTTRVVSTTNTATVAKTAAVGGTGVKYLRLNIDNERKEMSRGESVTYEVQWENISDTVTLNDLVLEVTMPKELQIVSSSRGDIDRSANAVYLNIDRLDPREEGRMTVTTRMNGSLRDNDPIVGRAIMAFENPTLEGAQENAIAYDSDRYRADNSVLGASAFGAGFLPGTLAGWLIIFLIIVLIILAARHYMRSGYYANDDRDHNGPYTPYRPQV